MIVSIAPMQGYTDAIFRMVHHTIIGGVDRYYAPYFKIENDGQISKKYLRDILPENNIGMDLVPQILTNKASDFNLAIPELVKMKYTELNWNLGCPYPMVAKRHLGSGLLPFPEKIDQVLSEIHLPKDFSISVKLRSGYINETDFYAVIEVLNKYPVKEIIFHPRIGKQMYKGKANRALYNEFLAKSQHPLAYNGDVVSIDEFNHIQSEIPFAQHIMIGRGLLYNPFLAKEIKLNQSHTLFDKRLEFNKFHRVLLEQYRHQLSGPGHLLTKMISYWEYFSWMFIGQHQINKEIKKCRSIELFEEKAERIIANEEFAKFLQGKHNQ
jgi:tRNA-dihydrouridine synthase